jgi:hypothetical protein
VEDASVNLLIAVALGWSAFYRARIGMALACILLIPGVATLWHHVCCNAAALVFSAQTFGPSNFASRSVRTARFVGVREATVLAYAKDDRQRPTHSVIDSDHERNRVWQFVRGLLRETGMQPHPLPSQRGCN